MAGKIPEQTLEKIRATVNIADYIGQYVALKPAGNNLFGVCPFHEENTPSFSVNESKQFFKCFSCGRGGSVFKFVQEYDKLSFPEAVAKVAAYAHIDLGVDVRPNRKPEDPQVTAQKDLLQQISDMCHHVLVNTQAGEKALAYLTQRGLSRATIDHFDIGYVPAERTLMRTFLTSKGVDYDTQRASGLFTEDSNGQLFDRFNDRVMFPLKDQYGAIIGFSGRVLTKGGQQAKYMNSPDTKLFNKRDVLFNLDHAKGEFKQHGGAILFEGFMDVIAAYQAGVPTGIASMGTSLTQEQVGILSRHTHNLTICYDGDDAGQAATERALRLVEAHPRLETNVVVLPDGMDPDEYIKAHGEAAFAQQVQSVLTPTAFHLQHLSASRDMTNDADKLAYIDAALPLVAKLPAGAGQAVYLQQISTLTGVAVADLRLSLPAAAPAPSGGSWAVDSGAGFAPPPEEPDSWAPPADYQAFGGAAYPSAPAPTPAKHYDRYETAERQLLAYAWQTPELTTRLHQTDFKFGHDQYQQLFDVWVAYAASVVQTDFAGYLDRVPAELSNLATALAAQALPTPSDELIDDLIALVPQESLRDKLSQLQQALRQAQTLGDKAGATQLGMQYVELMRAYKTSSEAE